jgi:hypothetical protein
MYAPNINFVNVEKMSARRLSVRRNVDNKNAISPFWIGPKRSPQGEKTNGPKSPRTISQSDPSIVVLYRAIRIYKLSLALVPRAWSGYLQTYIPLPTYLCLPPPLVVVRHRRAYRLPCPCPGGCLCRIRAVRSDAPISLLSLPTKHFHIAIIMIVTCLSFCLVHEMTLAWFCLMTAQHACLAQRRTRP